jgi:hypothetical protein
MVMKDIFLASSSELEGDRKDFEIFVNRKNKDWVASLGVFLNLVIWEDFLDAMSSTRLQDEYNKAIQKCDIFVVLLWTKVGKYTEEEFDRAYARFKAHGKPLIFTFFKDEAIDPENHAKSDLTSLWAFQNKLSEAGHFYTRYKSPEDLKLRFNSQLDKLAAAAFASVDMSQPASGSQLIKLNRDVAAASSAMFGFTEMLTKLSDLGRTTYSDDSARKELDSLINLTAKAKALPQSQVRFTTELDGYLADENPRPDDWARIVAHVAETTKAVKSFIDTIEMERSDFVLEAAYDQLLETAHFRSGLLRVMSKLPPPVSDGAKEAVRELSSRYKILIQSFKEAVKALNDYLKPRVAAYEQDQQRMRAARAEAIIAEALEKQKPSKKAT